MAMAMLVHGTTKQRATQIVSQGPDPKFIEPGGSDPAESFSTYLEAGPFPLGTPEEYACNKASLFPNEGGAVILKVDVPDDIIALAVDPVLFPLSAGIVQFDAGAGLPELIAAWPDLAKEIVTIECT